MKKFLFLISLLIIANPVFAECTNKCTDLMDFMYDKRATMYNVLNLSADQKKCKDTMDIKYQKEVGNKFNQYEQEKFVLKNLKEHNASKSAIRKQKRVVKNIEKSMEKLNNKYNKEFKSILDCEQKSKFNTISKMQKKELKYCQNNKVFYKRDPKLRPFGEKMYDENKVVCPVHNKRHLFSRIHKEK